jgi:hypothetical protein
LTTSLVGVPICLQVNTHIKFGMQGFYNITGPIAAREETGIVREYFIAAEEVIW